jgi:FHA domain
MVDPSGGGAARATRTVRVRMRDESVRLTAPLVAPSLGFEVSSYVEVWGRSGRELRALDSERLTVGTLESNDIVVDADGVSRAHAVFERFGDTWCVRDLGSRNGTFVNGQRIIGERALHSGDEILLGRLRLLFRGLVRGTQTASIAQPPPLTTRERDVLLALCRPLLTGDAFTEPASTRAIAAELVVSEAAVKQHLSRLYAKFEVDAHGERRRVRLANEAVARGAVKLGDLRPTADPR